MNRNIEATHNRIDTAPRMKQHLGGIKPRLAQSRRMADTLVPSSSRTIAAELQSLLRIPQIGPRAEQIRPAKPNIAAEETPRESSRADRLTQSLDQISTGLLELLAMDNVCVKPEAKTQPLPVAVQPSQPLATSALAPASLPLMPRSPATPFERALRNRWLAPDEEIAFRELAATMRRSTHSLRMPLLTVANLSQSPEAPGALVRLAMRLAEEHGRPVLLMDAAFAAPRLTTMFEQEANAGLSDVLQGAEKLRAALQPTSLANLDFLPAGRSFGMTNRGINSADFSAQVRSLDDCYAAVVCDVGTLHDAWSLAVARVADAAYLAVELGGTPMEVAVECIDRFRNAGREFSGCVVLGAE